MLLLFMENKDVNVFRLPTEIADLAVLNSKKYNIKPSEYISLCVKFSHKIELIPDEKYINNPKSISKFRAIHQAKKSEVELKKSIAELRTTLISFIKSQEKEILKPTQNIVEDLPKLMELYNIKMIKVLLEVMFEDERSREAMMKTLIKKILV
mgnify:CR=1 FL=1